MQTLKPMSEREYLFQHQGSEAPQNYYIKDIVESYKEKLLFDSETYNTNNQ